MYPIDSLIRPRNLEDLVDGRCVLDMGSANGALAFFLQSSGFKVHAVDCPSTNINGMRAIHTLKSALNSSVEIHEMDLDDRFRLPGGEYGLTLFLGTLYHLKNPFYALEAVARVSQYCILSTRIARWTPAHDLDFGRFPMAYLLDRCETNNDATNFWIFSEVGLRRLLQRTGWIVRNLVSTGEKKHSDPVHCDEDERAFCLLESEITS